jgi:hypothetical protein
MSDGITDANRSDDDDDAPAVATHRSLTTRSPIGMLPEEGDAWDVAARIQVDRDALIQGHDAIREMSPFRIMQACRAVMRESFALLEEMYQNAERFKKEVPRGLSMLPFHSVRLSPGDSQSVSTVSQQLFRGLFFVVDEACMDSFDIVDFRVGAISQFMNAQPISARFFGYHSHMFKIDTIQISQQVTVVVRNTHPDRAAYFDAALYGQAFEMPPIHMSPLPNYPQPATGNATSVTSQIVTTNNTNVIRDGDGGPEDFGGSDY